MAIELLWEATSFLCIKYSGTVTGDDILSSQKTISDDYRFEDMRNLIIDASRLENDLASESDIEKISAITIAQSKTNASVRNAVILNVNEDTQAFAAYYQFLAESTGWDIQLFETEGEARKWLGKL